ncbi:MAG: MFS transporter [Candidatus Pacebacteria bacterium]|nr:MFS transporter [Candidatus Paceibacterota bacterium]
MKLFSPKFKTLFNHAISILLFTNALVRLSNGMLTPIYALFVISIGGNLLDASLSGGVFALVAGLTSLVSGKLADELKESELMLVIGYLIMSFGYLLFFFTRTIPALLLAQALVGLGDAIYFPPFDAIYSKHAAKKMESSTWSLWEAMNYFTLAIGALLGGYLVMEFGFRVIFILMAGLCFISAAYIYFTPRKDL